MVSGLSGLRCCWWSFGQSFISQAVWQICCCCDRPSQIFLIIKNSLLSIQIDALWSDREEWWRYQKIRVKSQTPKTLPDHWCSSSSLLYSSVLGIQSGDLTNTILVALHLLPSSYLPNICILIFDPLQTEAIISLHNELGITQNHATMFWSS